MSSVSDHWRWVIGDLSAIKKVRSADSQTALEARAVSHFFSYLSYAPEITIANVMMARTVPRTQAPVGMSHSLDGILRHS